MADENSLENLSGPVPVPPPLGETPPSPETPITPKQTPAASDVVSKGFKQVAETLTNGNGAVGQAIGTGNKRTVTGEKIPTPQDNLT